MYAKDSSQAKYQLFINKHGDVGLRHYSYSKVFVEYLNDMDDIYKNSKESNLNKERKRLIVFYDVIADMCSNKNLQQIVTELFITSRKSSISHIFITQSYFAIPKNIRLNSTSHFIMKIPNKQEFQQLAFNHS